ncbi:PP2C domain-containing protein [Cephalotus follicularis]|uniref:PP2C domain-containing protein n=1 Tax=Cephalotus follicularis TaxID=3775 RepID=A0A1Q3AUG4_CEPFO|nr:PP2C domain-containing protein [Cephalotus follicularis]
MSKMLDLEEFLWSFSIVYIVLYCLRRLKKAISMPSSSLNSLSTSSLWSPLRIFVGQGKGSIVSEKLIPKNSKSDVFVHKESLGENIKHVNHQERSILMQEYSQSCEVDAKSLHDNNSHGMHDTFEKEIMQEDSHHQKGSQHDDHSESMDQGLEYSLEMAKVEDAKGPIKLRKRPSRLVMPQYSPTSDFKAILEKKLENKEIEIEGRDFFFASKKGRREVMEDGYGVMVDILGDPKQAFYAVIDGHGGQAASDYVAENLGKNIVKSLENIGEEEDDLKQAIREGYLVTDREFLNKGVSSGACAASALLKDGQLHVANVGDCKVVLSKKGIAHALTNDHRLSREDERQRIENSGGFVNCRNGVWRVHGSLAVSRAIGDMHLKDWVISEPEITRLHLTPDCDFLIMASDGLWDKVNEQEAVDVVLGDKYSLASCKKLVDISCSRGNMDDVTVMVINLGNFKTNN